MLLVEMLQAHEGRGVCATLFLPGVQEAEMRPGLWAVGTVTASGVLAMSGLSPGPCGDNPGCIPGHKGRLLTNSS